MNPNQQAKAPNFQSPEETVSPAIQKLLSTKFKVEDGIQFSVYKVLNACKSRSLVFNQFKIITDLSYYRLSGY